MTRQTKLYIFIALGIAVLATTTLIMFATGSGGGSTNIAPFIPVWFAVMIPVLVARREQNAEDAHHEKAKRKRHLEDRYTMIEHLVDDLNRDELDYLKRLVDNAYDDLEQDEAPFDEALAELDDYRPARSSGSLA